MAKAVRVSYLLTLRLTENMNELYRLIEKKIKASGYPGVIDGKQFYDDVSAEAENQEDGTYQFLIKRDDGIVYSGCMDIMEKEFDLHYVDIITDDMRYRVDFDS